MVLRSLRLSGSGLGQDEEMGKAEILKQRQHGARGLAETVEVHLLAAL